ncbi:hypothetical protein [Proteiniclasticum sp.]|uniref:anti-sigma-I factor RsgI family protein n=1 Tax=Proteiniclasticum sp. TaxID=2053595 RepID=UPI0028A0C861|nr:hypothetical protein [Proteiniclasticum sp.]
MVNRVLDKDRYIFLEKPAMEVYNKEETLKRADEIEAYISELKTFNISLEKLSATSLSKAERSLILNLAFILSSEEKLWDKVLENRRIPFSTFSKLVEEPVFELKKWHDLILSYSILFHGEKYPLITRYLQYDLKEKEDSFPIDSDAHSGLTLRKKGSYAYILSSQGQFMKIKDEGNSVGDVTSGKKARKRPNLLKPLIAIVMIALILGLAYQYMSEKVDRTIIIRAEGEIKMNFNPWGNLVSISAVNPKGQELIEKSDPEQNDIDTVLAEIIEQAYISEAIKERDEIIILISGEFLPEDFFKSGKTHDRILSYQLDCKINNNGSFLYVE